MADKADDSSLYPIAVLIDELKNEDIQVSDKDHPELNEQLLNELFPVSSCV